MSDGIYYRADYLPAGFLISTAGDLGHYLKAILNGGQYRGTSVLNAKYVRQMLAPSAEASTLGQHKTYGFGWYQEKIGTAPVVTHPGSAINTHADVVLVPSRHAAVAVLANAESVPYAVFPRVDIVAANAAMTAAGLPRRGSVAGLYEVFDVLAVMLLVVLGRNLLNAWRCRTRGPALREMSKPRLLFTLWREFLVPVVLFIEAPRRLGGSPTILLHSDVGLVIVCWAILGLSAFLVRVVPPWRTDQPTGRRWIKARSHRLDLRHCPREVPTSVGRSRTLSEARSVDVPAALSGVHRPRSARTARHERRV